MKTYEELEREIRLLTSQLETAHKTIEALRYNEITRSLAFSEERRLSAGLTLENEKLRQAFDELRTALAIYQESSRKAKTCLCGCGEPVQQNEKGRRKKFINDAHASRYYRQKRAIEAGEKIFLSVKRQKKTGNTEHPTE